MSEAAAAIARDIPRRFMDRFQPRSTSASLPVTVSLFVLGALLLSGCVQEWEKGGGTRAEYERDRKVCEKYARLGGPLVEEAKFSECMEERGYRKAGRSLEP